MNQTTKVNFTAEEFYNYSKDTLPFELRLVNHARVRVSQSYNTAKGKVKIKFDLCFNERMGEMVVTTYTPIFFEELDYTQRLYMKGWAYTQASGMVENVGTVVDTMNILHP